MMIRLDDGCVIRALEDGIVSASVGVVTTGLGELG